MLAALVVVNLVLSAAIIRRLRETEAKLIEMTTPAASGLPLGGAMPEFVSPDGQVSSADLAGGPVLVGFFSAGCRHCPAQAEALADRAEEIGGGGVRVLSFLTAGEGETDDLAPTLRKAGLLVTEGDTSAMMTTFQVQGTPAFLMFGDDGRLLARGHELSEVINPQ
ncbi:TlpA family protein disulfide reductase [Micromonospora sp. KC606]|uniref:TlpA disulfide reductase family protein n=1 Tax=Micromonospora sp. KC606 TaxID=2530379 RepID=UPI00104D8C35|nr:TlpA disulfide reductase family protein [Micromonospora sp. KC606]TDC85943.1 TlpA family protein disulfide reductase [Micromonospora sp. KC606]